MAYDARKAAEFDSSRPRKTEEVAALIAAVIEDCARVADEAGRHYDNPPSVVAARIRAMKTK